MHGFFITGTDTDTGKTVAGTAVLSVLRQRGIDCQPMKPVQTGCYEQDGELTSPDLQFYLNMNVLTPGKDEEKQMSLYQFRPACSPHLAARKQGVDIKIPEIVHAARQLDKHHDMILIEGAGGVIVPLTESSTMLDLMQAVQLPVILVTRPGLGTINHTLLSLKEIRRAGLEVRGVIMCSTQPVKWGDVENDNRRTIETFGNTEILGCLPFNPDIASGECSSSEFQQMAKENLNL